MCWDIICRRKPVAADLHSTFCTYRIFSIPLQGWLCITGVHNHSWHHQRLLWLSVFLTWLCLWGTCWAGGAGWKRTRLGWRRRGTSSPGHLGRTGSDRHQCHSHWGAGPLCSSSPAASSRFRSWTGGRLGRRSSACWRFPGWPTGGEGQSRRDCEGRGG